PRMIKWLTVILIVAISLFASGWMLESLGVIDIESGVMSALERVPGLSHRIAIYKVGLEADRILSRSARELSELHAELAESRRRMEEERAAYQAARERIDSEWAAL